MSRGYDHVVIGAGHNGLVCAIQPRAQAGAACWCWRRPSAVGGAAVTREFSPGYRVSAAAHLLDMLPADLLAELELERHGLRFAARALPT